MGGLLLFAGTRLSSHRKPDRYGVRPELIERLLYAPGLPLKHDRDVARGVTTAACVDLVNHSQQARLRGNGYRKLVSLAEGVLNYDSESKHLFHSVYLPLPVLSNEWIRHLQTWLARIKRDETEATRRGRPANTWEPHLFASGLGLYSALYGRAPATTGGAGQKPGPAMRFMIELIAVGRTICKEHEQDTVSWRGREYPALKKQIKALLDFELSRPPRRPDPNVSDTLDRRSSYIVYRDIFLAQLRGQAPFPNHSWDDPA